MTYLLLAARATLLACRSMSLRPADHPSVAPVSTGLRIIESLTIVLFALIALLLALK